MDAAAALADLTELSAQLEAAVIASEDGTPEAATVGDAAAAALARAGAELLGEGAVRASAVTREGGVFAVREEGRLAVAVSSGPPGLVLYDLRTALRRLAEAKPKRRTRKKKADA